MFVNLLVSLSFQVTSKLRSSPSLPPDELARALESYSNFHVEIRTLITRFDRVTHGTCVREP